MKKYIVFALFMAIYSISAIAQTKLTPRDILDRTAQRLNTKGGIKATFTTTVYEKTLPKDIITGTMDMLGEKYVLKTEAVCTWFNGKDQWNLIYDTKEVSLVTPTQEELQTSSPIAFAGMYKQGFNLSSKSAELRGRKVWEVTMKPQKRKAEPSVITISIDKETFDPLCIRIRNNGDWTRISIDNFNSNAGLTLKDFTYPAAQYPDFDVIDMR